MPPEELRQLLDDPSKASKLLGTCGLDDPRRAHENLVRIALAGVTLDLLGVIVDVLTRELPKLSDPDMALNNLERFFEAARNPLSLAALFERDPESLPTLLKIFSTSQFLSDLLIRDREAYDLLRMTEGQPVARQTLAAELCAEIGRMPDDESVLKLLRRHKRRETLRIAFGDIILEQSLSVVTAQISYLADALVEAAVQAARRKLSARRGVPRRPDGLPARFVVLALGKLGGVELNYSSDIDLIFLYDADGQTDGARPISNAEFFNQLGRDVIRLLSENTAEGQVYRVDMRLRPEGNQGPIVHSLEQALRYYDVMGRTWERQAFVKARPVAGDVDLGQEFLRELEPWIYRRYLGLADIAGIKALKRRIEHRALREGAEDRNVKTGRGGIRDVEFVIQFLQLLNGGDLPDVRVGNTLVAMEGLERGGCLTHAERILLEENLSFLRKIEHRLQIMFDLQTHELPTDRRELRKLAIRMGYADKKDAPALAAFQKDLERCKSANRRILDHLLHEAFGNDAESEPEVDLVLDPDPPPEKIHSVLGKYGFRDIDLAYRNLISLSTERIPFLSTRRCRHFLASNAPKLLRAIAETPDPDATLVNLEKVSDSLGGKAVLWELFNFNPPTLRLYVELCAISPYLSSILIGNPGMIDELMDGLLLNRLPSLDWLRRTITELCRGAEDLQPILHSFKNTQLLQIGVRDILAKEDIGGTMQALSDVAQVCLEQVIRDEWRKLAPRLGEPTIGEGPRAGEPCELIVLAMGKFGGAELNYHSDLDVIFLYDADGPTRPLARTSTSTTNAHFFAELCTRIIKSATYLGPWGRLYDVDPRLRPTGRNGALVTSLEELARYYETGEGTIWERQALCRARVVFGSPELAQRVESVLRQAVFGAGYAPEHAQAIWTMRLRMQEGATLGNLKRGIGGIADIEFATQLLLLRHGPRHPELRIPNTMAALVALHERGFLNADDFRHLTSTYVLLRRIESRLRLMYTTSRDELPCEKHELAKLARNLGYERTEEMLADCHFRTSHNRRVFERLCGGEE